MKRATYIAHLTLLGFTRVPKTATDTLEYLLKAHNISVLIYARDKVRIFFGSDIESKGNISYKDSILEINTRIESNNKQEVVCQENEYPN
jgi:hypothetical protein